MAVSVVYLTVHCRGIKWTRDNLPLARHVTYAYKLWLKSVTGSNCLISLAGLNWEGDSIINVTLLLLYFLYPMSPTWHHTVCNGAVDSPRGHSAACVPAGSTRSCTRCYTAYTRTCGALGDGRNVRGPSVPKTVIIGWDSKWFVSVEKQNGLGQLMSKRV